MIEIVDLLVRGDTFSERYVTQKIPLVPGDMCLVESDIGLQIAKVLSKPRVMKKKFADSSLPRVIRKASDSDIEHLDDLEQIEREAEEYCLDSVKSHKLEMKLTKVLFAFDRSKALFMFTADGRIDFRDLVRDLAHNLKTRIEMRQIGIRDEARILGGVGNCGCTLCCVRFLREFHPVSIKMAKDQGLSLIPSKISGLCGRLMCCLQYEHEHYSEAMKTLPKIGKRVITPDGEGRVRQLNVLTGKVLVELQESGEVEDYLADQVERLIPPDNKPGQGKNQPAQSNDQPTQRKNKPVQSKDQSARSKDQPTQSRNKPFRDKPQSSGSDGQTTRKNTRAVTDKKPQNRGNNSNRDNRKRDH